MAMSWLLACASGHTLAATEGTLYPMLSRLQKDGHIAADPVARIRVWAAPQVLPSHRSRGKAAECHVVGVGGSYHRDNGTTTN